MTDNYQHELDGKQYLQDEKGRLVPVGMVPEIDKMRDSLVKHVVKNATELHALMKKFKEDMLSSIDAFVKLSALEYDVKIGGVKGNLKLTAFDGAYMVQVQVQDHIDFDERLMAAKKLIDECLSEWTEGSQDEVKVIINDAFLTNQSGLINTKRILTLRRYNIQHQKWREAMTIIADSITTIGSSTYLRVYQRAVNGQWDAISLDMARI